MNSGPRQPIHLVRLDIGPRLGLCFLIIIVLMLTGYGLLLWQFQVVHTRSDRLTAVGQELVAVTRFQIDFFRLTARLDELAASQDLDLLKKEGAPLRGLLQSDTEQARKVISNLPTQLPSDATILPTLEAIQSTLPPQLARVTALAEASDWEAVRLRLANEKGPLEAEVSGLVRAVEQQVSTELSAQLVESAQAERRIAIIVPVTAILTLTVAAVLGVFVTRSITRPLGGLLAVSQRLAKGDFSQQIPTNGTDELATLSAVFNDMIVRLQELYSNVRRSEAFLADGQKLSLTGSYSWKLSTNEITWSEQLYRIYELEVGIPITPELIRERVHPQDQSLFEMMLEKARQGRSDFEWHYRLLMPDESIKYLHAVAHATRDEHGQLEYMAVVQDVTTRRLSEEALAKARSELAKVARTTTLGVLTASIAHEVNQPLSGIITNASTCLRMLSTEPPNVEGARETARRTIRDGNRASDVISRLRTLYSRKDPQPEPMDLNEAAREVISLSLSDLQRNGVILRHDFADDLPAVTGDKIQLQQVILNLLRNAWDAMSTIEDHPRYLVVRTERDGESHVRLSVMDTGIGFPRQTADKLFDAFYTTKTDGMGIGLSISRSIIEAHHGRLWATANDGPGATFSFAIPCRGVSLPGDDAVANQSSSATDAA